MILEIDRFETPLGEVTIASREGRLCAMTFSEYWPRLEALLARRLGGVECVAARDGASLRARLDAYFAGDLGALDDIVVDPAGTDFQRAVWSALRRVRAGETVSYSALARTVGAPAAMRAVGAANGANPIWLVIPCHRAIGADGSLTGYAGGLERKRWLLAHEGAMTRTLTRRHGVTERKSENQIALLRVSAPPCECRSGRVGDPVAVEAERHARRQLDDGDGRPGDIRGVEHDQVGGAARGVVDVLQQPALVLAGAG